MIRACALAIARDPNTPTTCVRYSAVPRVSEMGVAAARTAATAGAAAIEVEWEDLPLVDNIDAALAPGAPLVHPENGLDTNA